MRLEDVARYYMCGETWHEVDIGGTVIHGEDKSVASAIRVVRKLTAGEVYNRRGYGDGLGHSYGNVNDCGYGYGYGDGDGNGCGNGNGYGNIYGNGYGNGRGYGDGHGYGSGNGNGCGYGNGCGCGCGNLYETLVC
jgi:hypothetical protein